MTKPVFDDEFKQGVVDYVNQHLKNPKFLLPKNLVLQIAQFING